MLSYHKAHDPLNTALRMMLLLRAANLERVELLRLRLMDFYCVFPNYFERFRFPQGLTSYRKNLKAVSKGYANLLEPNQMFVRMEGVQLATIKGLIGRNLLSIGTSQTELECNFQAWPESLVAKIDERIVDSVLVDFIAGPIAELPLLGKDGLKHRSGFMEYRYDAI